MIFFQALAVDGNRSPKMWENSCINANRWWICDMQDFRLVSKVVVYMRNEFRKFVKLWKILITLNFYDKKHLILKNLIFISTISFSTDVFMEKQKIKKFT